MKYLLLALPFVVTACAGHPIKEISPNTYQISHSTGRYGTVKGIRSGITGLAQQKCASENGPYQKLREEITPEKTLTYTLTFTCTPTLQGSGYTGTEAHNIQPSVSPSSTQPVMNTEPSGNTQLKQ